MNDKPIPFMSAMLRAVQDGRKTMTRRGLKLKGYKDFSEFQRSETIGFDWAFRRKDKAWCDFPNVVLLNLLPFQVGDTLWVKEQLKRGSNGEVIYAADNHVHPDANWTWKVKTLPPMFCPLGLSRITLRVTGVKIEQLNDISEADAIAEGCGDASHPDMAALFAAAPSAYAAAMATTGIDPVTLFEVLWESISDEDAFDDKYIAAYTFERIA